jgi:biotin carboxylase
VARAAQAGVPGAIAGSMPLKWRISDPRRLVLAWAEGELARGDLLAFVAAIDRQDARSYPKILDVSRVTTVFPTDRLEALAHIARVREATSAVGAIAIVAGAGVARPQAELFAESGQFVRPIRVFGEHHEARRWIRDLTSGRADRSPPSRGPAASH